MQTIIPSETGALHWILVLYLQLKWDMIVSQGVSALFGL